MAYYLCRDYLSQNTTTNTRTYISSYIMSIFLRRIMSYSYVGDTNFPINTLGSLLIATGDTTPTIAPTFPGGNKVGIANNAGAIEISIPLSIKGVTSFDIGRILAIKSTKYPTRNSGLFLITGLQQGNTTTVAAGSNGQALPGSGNIINVASTTGFPTSGTIFIGASATTTTVVALTGTFTLTVGSTTGFPTSGTLFVSSTTGTQTVAYTGSTTTTFTGCTGGTGSTFSGGTVTTNNGIQSVTYTGITGTSFTGTAGGTGTLITGEPIYNQNKYIIDYRGNGDAAITENNDTVQWWLYDKDINCPSQGGANNKAAGLYRSDGTSTTPRIILQSPHALGWQVRICNEGTSDNIFNGCTAVITMAPGFGGNSSGDFTVGGDHLHGSQYFDISGPGIGGKTDYITGNGCGDTASTGPQYRYTIIADDGGQSVAFMARRPLNAVTPRSFNMHFGIPDNETDLSPIKNIRRLFVLGNTRDPQNNGPMSDMSLSVGGMASNTIQGTTFYNSPISCHPSLLAYLTGNVQKASPMFDTAASDSPFTSSTELISADLTTGLVYSWEFGTPQQALQIFPRVMGALPIVKIGRSNFSGTLSTSGYTLTTDNASWSVSNATNATPIQITTSTTNTLVTGQTVAIFGVGGNTAANATFTVTVINNTNFTLDGSVGNGAFTSGGTVLLGANWQHMRNGIFIPWNGPAVVP